MPAVGVGGMVDRFDRERQANWHSGQVRITFDVVREVPGKRFRWVCGAVTADLVGAMEPPPGAMQPVTVTGMFEGRFQAEWYHER